MGMVEHSRDVQATLLYLMRDGEKRSVGRIDEHWPCLQIRYLRHPLMDLQRLAGRLEGRLTRPQEAEERPVLQQV